MKQVTKLIMDSKEKAIIKKFLNGELGSRKAGKMINKSHQTVINLVCALARQWYQEGKLKL